MNFFHNSCCIFLPTQCFLFRAHVVLYYYCVSIRKLFCRLVFCSLLLNFHDLNEEPTTPRRNSIHNLFLTDIVLFKIVLITVSNKPRFIQPNPNPNLNPNPNPTLINQNQNMQVHCVTIFFRFKCVFGNVSIIRFTKWTNTTDTNKRINPFTTSVFVPRSTLGQ